jgi:hypothetical protein
MMNIPMEAFEEFCRAKTNFYVFEKVGKGEPRQVMPKKAPAKRKPGITRVDTQKKQRSAK